MLFRDLNERIREVSERLFVRDESIAFVCECGREGCLDRLDMTLEDIESVRAEPTWFAVVPGHELEHLEQVVERRPGYTIVAKPWLA
jgi:hypothetical protein